ncbi:MAG: multidrug effflux MFS transporter [Pseudomonadota bacterium]
MTLPDRATRERGEAPIALLGLLALMTSVVALTIDAVLPALDAMSADLAFTAENDRHAVIFAVFAGLALAQVVVGPVADAIGRRRTVMVGYAVYLGGTLLCFLAWNPEALLAGRFLQGAGAAAPRVVAVTIVRDLYSGRPMARILSLVNTIFMAVPMLAPLVGQGLELAGGWRAIFAFYMAAAAISLVWYLAAIPETLAPENRRPLALRPLAAALMEVLRTRQALLCTAITSAVFGSFTAYLATSQQIFEELYGLGALFPATFALLAGAFAVTSFLNGRLVMRFGMRRLSGAALWLMTGAAALGTALAAAMAGMPPLWLLLLLLSTVFMAVALVFANMIALATEPLGHVAGTATSVALAASTLGASALGALIASFYDGSVTPLFAGFTALGVLALLLFRGLPRDTTAESPR